MSTAHSEFARRAARRERVIVRLSPEERRELERLARKSKSTISDVLRDGVAHVRRLHADAECVQGNEG
jgi:hypothetical protein